MCLHLGLESSEMTRSSEANLKLSVFYRNRLSFNKRIVLLKLETFYICWHFALVLIVYLFPKCFILSTRKGLVNISLKAKSCTT